MTEPAHPIAFLLSGSGSTLANLLDEIEAGRVPARVVVVVSDRPGVGGLEIAKARGIATAIVDRKVVRGDAFSNQLEQTLRPHAPELVVSGGFLSIYKVPPDLQGRIINVHPSLLPAFGGKGCWGHHVHRAVLKRGCRLTGCTVHYTTDEVDGGPIIEQASVRVLPDDTVESLAARVQALERDLYPKVIAKILGGHIRLHQGRVLHN